VFPVYIESTDAFGVAFYATYPVLLERFLSVTFESPGYLKSTKLMKFKIAAKMGDNLQFSVGSKNTVVCSLETGSQLFTAKGAVFDGVTVMSTAACPILDLPYKRHESKFVLYRDEFEVSASHMRIPTRSIFNLFERGRTDALGGPSKLSQAAVENTHIYVARITDYEHISVLPLALLNKYTLDLRVVSHTVPFGDTMVEFVQQIILDGDTTSTTPRLIAKAKVLCCSVDAVTGLPAPFGSSVKALFG
jgi:acyl-CoA thioesterase FadM